MGFCSCNPYALRRAESELLLCELLLNFSRLDVFLKHWIPYDRTTPGMSEHVLKACYLEKDKNTKRLDLQFCAITAALEMVRKI